jgi:hypothetical protein
MGLGTIIVTSTCWDFPDFCNLPNSDGVLLCMPIQSFSHCQRTARCQQNSTEPGVCNSFGHLQFNLRSVLPFLTFGADVKQRFLQSTHWPDGSQEIPLIVVFIFAALALSVSYALLSLPVRASIMTFVFGNKQPDGSREVRWRVFITICMLLVSFGSSAALGDNLSLPIEIAGLLGGNTLGFVFPFTLYLKHYGLKMTSRYCRWPCLSRWCSVACSIPSAWLEF